ncbi:MAG: NYN domain-containing protein, partial [Clostridium sp.]|nr:NYN domain-containing protein [Clostridium sp.]
KEKELEAEQAQTAAERVRVGRRPGGKSPEKQELFIGQEEIDEILSRAAYANSNAGRYVSGYAKCNANSRVHSNMHSNMNGNAGGKEGRAGVKKGWKRERAREDTASTGEPQKRVYKQTQKKEEYLLVDGYNVIFAWEELKELAGKSLDGARGKLLDLLCNYQAVRGCQLIAVFDAYRLAGHPTEFFDYHNIHVVYTKEAETADQYIERFAHENSHKYDVTVATSDGLEQIIIVGEGCRLISSRELKEEMEQAAARIIQNYAKANPNEKISMGQMLSKEGQAEIDAFYQRPQKV